MGDRIRYSDRIYNVLFLSTTNCARSLMAESIMRKNGTLLYKPFSAGLEPAAEVHPLTLKTLEHHSYPTDNLKPKGLAAFEKNSSPDMDMIFTFCDRSHGQAAAFWPGHSLTAMWSIPDPTLTVGDEAARMVSFNRAFDTVHEHIAALLVV